MDSAELLLSILQPASRCVIDSPSVVCGFRRRHEPRQLFSRTFIWNTSLETTGCYSGTDHSRYSRHLHGFLVCLWFFIWSRVLVHTPGFRRYVCWHLSQLTCYGKEQQ